MIAIRFDGPPSHLSGRFVEVEQDGKGISFGEWKQDGDDWLLVLPVLNTFGLVSYCAEHNTYPVKGEPCWQCANPHIVQANLGCSTMIKKLKANIEDLEKRVRLGVDPACFGNQEMVFTKDEIMDEIMDALRKLWMKP